MHQQKQRFAWLIFLFIANLGLLLSIFFWRPDVLAHSYNPVPAPQATQPLPEIIATQQVQIETLQRQVEYLNQDNELLAKDYQIQMDNKIFWLGTVALGISFLAAVLGWKSYNDIGTLVRERIEHSFDLEILGFDPKSLQVRLKSDQALTLELARAKEMLELYGILPTIWTAKLNKFCTQGITVIPIETEKDEQDLVDFLENYDQSISPTKAAFVIYALKGYRIKSQTVLEHQCVTLANLPVTAANAVLIVGRGLR